RPDHLGRRHRRADRDLHQRRRQRHLPPRHAQRAPVAAPDVCADDAALAARPVRRAAAAHAHLPYQVADPAQPVHLPGHAHPRQDHREGDVGTTGGTPAVGSFRPVGPKGFSTGGHAPRSSRGVATAAKRYTIAATAAGYSNVTAICTGEWPKYTEGASTM